MSIEDEIEARRDEGRLVNVPLLIGEAQPRVIFARAELYEEINKGAASDMGSSAYRIGQLRSDFDWFTSEGLIVVGYGDEDKCNLKPLDPRIDEVWEMRSRDPKPSIRVFGRFAMQDVFIATHMEWRCRLKERKSREWSQEIRNCKAYWRQLFESYPAHKGNCVNDYISANVVEISNLP